MTQLHDIHAAALRMRRSVSWIYHNKHSIKYTQTCPGAPIYFTDEQIEWNIAAAAREPIAAKPQQPREVKQKPAPRQEAKVGASVVDFAPLVSRPEAARGGRKKRRSA